MSAPREHAIEHPPGAKIFDFLKKGDVLAKHQHVPASAHTIDVSRGSLFMTEWINGEPQSRVLNTGAHVDPPDNVTHEFKALEDNTRMATYLKNPR